MNLLILLYLFLIAPKLLFDRIVKGKRHPDLLQRLGFGIPRTTQPVIWIHAVSVGEVKAAQPLFRALRERNPQAFFLVTTTSATGHAEARRSLAQADAVAYLPVDLTWVVNRWIKALNPRQFFLIESDFWYNLLTAMKKEGTQIYLVSGKISDRSAKRFSYFPYFAKKMFSCFEQICVQNENYFQLFLPLVPDPSRLHVTGNLKLDIEPQSIDPQQLAIPANAITISCTHPQEEEWLLDALLDGDWYLILAPRHPERFEEVAQLLTSRNVSFSRWSQTQKTGRVLLVDAMGQLPLCYSKSRLAIVAGSFVEHIGGHNVLEPCLYGTPVFFGPHTFGQTEFATRAQESGAGCAVSLAELRSAVQNFFADHSLEQRMKTAAIQLIEKGRGSTAKTLEKISRLCLNH